MTDRLILFTRYPEPGKAKTRLIPALGAEGAAALHRQMTEHTIAQMRSLQALRPVELEVQFVGGSVAQMQAWLGSDWRYREQAAGNLGDRMAAAFHTAFAEGCASVLLIGSDCPDLDALLLDKGFQALQQQDLVLGAAADGGYYLIGLRRSLPDLFQGIAWSTATVRQQTLAIATRLGLTIAELPLLADVDTPADLVIWQRVSAQIAQAAQISAATQISVIVPTLNEAANLAQTLTAALTAQVEIIVVDGGSTDATIAIAQQFPVRLMQTAAGRAHQMNAGAAIATGEILLFLHGDTQLPPGYDALIRQALALPQTIAGAFELQIEGTAPGLRWVEWGVKWRSRLLQLPYGDQAIFLKAATFQAIGGFADLPIMEDFELMQRLKQQGKVTIVPASVRTAGRRWQKLGVFRTTLINQGIILAYQLGVSPDLIVRWYGKSRKAKAERQN